MQEVPLGERLDALLDAPLFPYRDNFDALGAMDRELEEHRRRLSAKRARIVLEMYDKGASWRGVGYLLGISATHAERLGKSARETLTTTTTTEGPS